MKTYDPNKLKLIVAGKEIPTFTKHKESKDIIINKKNEITATIDGKKILGPCKISIFTKKYYKNKKENKLKVTLQEKLKDDDVIDEFMCDKTKNTNVTQKTIKELKELNLEYSDWWKK